MDDQRPRRRPSASFIIACLALFVALAGTANSATGGAFLLGKTNRAGDPTTLKSAISGAPTLTVKNTGGRPAARFLARKGAPPIAVGHNRTKVKYLNADRLDGKSAVAFVRRCGRGSVAAFATWYAPQVPATAVEPNRYGGEGGFACNGGTLKLTKEGTGHYRMKIESPALPSKGSYVAFVNADARSDTALYGQGTSKLAGPVWDIYVHNGAGALATPYYLDVMLLRQ